MFDFFICSYSGYKYFCRGPAQTTVASWEYTCQDSLLQCKFLTAALTSSQWDHFQGLQTLLLLTFPIQVWAPLCTLCTVIYVNSLQTEFHIATQPILPKSKYVICLRMYRGINEACICNSFICFSNMSFILEEKFLCILLKES